MIEEKLLNVLQHALQFLEIDENYEVSATMHKQIQLVENNIENSIKPVLIDLTKLFQ